MTNRIRTGIVLSMLCFGPVGCDRGSPVLPSPPPVNQSTAPAAIQPIVTAIAPQIGSTRGGAWATITGADFQFGARVKLGDSSVSAYVLDSRTIAISSGARAAGSVDVVVTNPGGLEARLTDGYAYQNPESFDFNGEWIAHAGPDYELDMRFTIRHNVLVSVSCGSSEPVSFLPPPSVSNAEFSFRSDAGLGITGTIVSPVNAVGSIDVPGCPAAPWWADKSAGAASGYASPRR